TPRPGLACLTWNLRAACAVILSSLVLRVLIYRTELVPPGRNRAHLPVCLHRMRRPARGGAEVHRRSADRARGLRRPAAQGLLARGHRLQGVWLLPDRQP